MFLMADVTEAGGGGGGWMSQSCDGILAATVMTHNLKQSPLVNSPFGPPHSAEVNVPLSPSTNTPMACDCTGTAIYTAFNKSVRMCLSYCK